MNMKGKVNSKFFEANNKKEGLKSLSHVCKEGRRSGTLNMSNRSLLDVPMIIFSEVLDDDEKFWEINPYTKLDLSFNQIRALPLEITTLTELTNLKIRNNEMNQLPRAIFDSMQKLNHLDLSFNKLASVDDSIGNLVLLKELLLASNRLNEIPASIARCSCLTLLEVQDNMLRRFPSICHITSLTSINLSNNNITDLPAEFLYFAPSLKSIELRKNKISTLPNLDKFMSMTYLDLTENCLLEFPVLPRKGALDRLYLGFNKLRNIDALAAVTSVSEVKTNNNVIDTCPNLEKLVSLKMIDISNNNLSDINPSLGFLVELVKIIVDGNPIRTIRRTLLHGSTHDLKAFLRTRVKEEVPIGCEVDTGDANIKIIVNNKPVNVTETRYKYLVENRIRGAENKNIDLSRRKNIDNDLCIDDEKLERYVLDCLMRSHFYDYDSNILNITSLSLEGNYLTMQSLRTFQPLSLLRLLNLRGNQLGSVNSGTVFRNSNGYLPSSLLSLDISSNNISDALIVQLISGLNLERLFATNNNLSMIPSSLALHSNLKELDISMNQIKCITFTWNLLSRLECINLSSNKIESIEPLIESILSSSPSTTRVPLRTLKLENNNLKEVPAYLGLPIFDNMRELGLHGNAIKSIPFSTIDKGCDKIREILKNRM